MKIDPKGFIYRFPSGKRSLHSCSARLPATGRKRDCLQLVKEWMLIAFVPVAVLAAEPPNVLLILADDMGYGDAGFNGCKDIPTPHIDSIAANGVRFTDGYVTAPQCGPSRAGLLTGISQSRFGCEENHAIEPDGIPAEYKLFGDYLRTAGYRTGIVGKWHLGLKPGSRPLDRGFDWFYGFLRGGSHFFPQPGQESIPSIFENTTPQKVTQYLTDDLTDAAIRFVGQNPDKPFFLYLSYNAPHAPLQAPKEYLERFKHLAIDGEPGVHCNYTKTHIDHPRQVYAAMVSNLDDNIGRVLAAVNENTLIFFLSDNGGPTTVTSANNDPLRGFKGDILDGGSRVPFAVQWNGRIAPGQTVETPVSSLDLLPTALSAAGAEIPEVLDGENLFPIIGKTDAAERSLLWRFPHPPHCGVWGIRRGDWKLVHEALRGPMGRGWNKQTPGRTGLYRLSDDVREEKDLSDQFPEIRQRLQAEWDAWNATLPQGAAQ